MVTEQSHPLGRPAIELLPNLAGFFGGYFHQDWMELEGATPDDVLKKAISEWPTDELEDVRRELSWLLEQPLHESSLDYVFFRELRVSYWTYADQMSPRIWLQRVLSTVAQATWKQ